MARRRLAQTRLTSQAARWNFPDMIPGVFRIISWQLWGQAHQKSPGPFIS